MNCNLKFVSYCFFALWLSCGTKVSQQQSKGSTGDLSADQKSSPPQASQKSSSDLECRKPFRLLVANPTYEADIKPMIQAKCAWCHSPLAAPNIRETPYLTTFEEVKQSGTASLSTMQRGRMPPRNVKPVIEAGDTETFGNWVNQGFKRGVIPAPLDSTKPVFYRGQIEVMLALECVSCHKPGVIAPDLSTYELAKSLGSASLNSIVAGRMPPSGPLGADKEAAFRVWVDGGAPLEPLKPNTPPNAPTSPPPKVPPQAPSTLPPPSKQPPAEPSPPAPSSQGGVSEKSKQPHPSVDPSEEETPAAPAPRSSQSEEGCP